jgi:cytochrome c-type biogenesis protein CcmH
MDQSIASLKTQLQQLKGLLDSGVLPADQYEKSKSEIERRILDAVMQGNVAVAQPQRPPQVDVAQGPATPSKAGVARARPSYQTLGVLGLVVLLIAGGGYYWKSGTTWQADSKVASDGSGNADANQAGAPHSTQTEQVNAMVEKLAQRLKDEPNDAEGWSMLARSYGVIGRNAEALAAYEKAVALRKDDPNLLADYADALAVKNNRILAGEPNKLVERALKLDPKNLKALALAGSYAFELKDYANAAKIWEKLVAIGPADNAFVKQFGPAIDEARNLAGLPPIAKPLEPTAALSGAAANTSKADSQPLSANGVVSGKVTLAAALASQAKPDDTVFIFARPSEGSRMPLAILRKQVKDLPISFSLDDSMAMSSATKLSGASKVVVAARISKGGNAMPQPGDLVGQTPPVPVGSKGLQITISDVVKP